MSDLILYTDGHGSITGDFSDGSWTINQNQFYNIVASPAANYAFWYWQHTVGTPVGLDWAPMPFSPGTIDIYNPSITFASVLNSPADDITWVAHFQPAYNILTLDTDSNGSTVPSGQQQVQSGSATQITAISNSGYYFKNWTVTDGSAIFSNSAAASTTVTITADATILASFDTKLITIGNISDDTPGIGMELRSDGKIYCYVVDARETGNTDQLNYNTSTNAINSTIAIFDTRNINFYDGSYHSILFEWSITNDNSRYGILHVDGNYYTSSILAGEQQFIVGKQTPCTFTFDRINNLGTYFSLGANLYSDGVSALSGYTKNNKIFTGKYHKFILWDTVLSNQKYLKNSEDDPFIKSLLAQEDIKPLTDSNLQPWKKNVVAYYKFDAAGESGSENTIDKYEPSDVNWWYQFNIGGDPEIVGQSFMGHGSNLDSCEFYLAKTGEVGLARYCQAALYAHSGVYGTSSIPLLDENLIATPLELSAIRNILYTDPDPITEGPAWQKFKFSGHQVLENGVPYIIAFIKQPNYDNGFINLGITINTNIPLGLTHAGNACKYFSFTGWEAEPNRDLVFRVNTIND